MASAPIRLCLTCSEPSESSICQRCRCRPVRVTCQHCQTHLYSASPGNDICPACYSNLKLGPARPCQFCCLNAAFAGASICRRCLEYRANCGPPSVCQSCGLLAAFPRTTRQLERTNFQLLCFICTRNYKCRHPRRRRIHAAPTVYSPQRHFLDVIPVVFTPDALSYFDLSEVVFVFPLVCKAFRDILLPPTSRVLSATKFKSLTVSQSFDNDFVIDRLCTFIGTGISSIRRLSLAGCVRITLSLYLPRFTGVAHLDLTGCTFDTGVFDLLKLPSLVSLRVDQANRRSSASSPGRLTSAPSLRLIDAGGSYFGPDLINGLPSSNRVEFVDLSNTDVEQNQLSSLRDLRYLDISNVRSNASSVLFISQRFQHLQYLNVRGAGKQFGSSHLRRLLTSCKVLQTLDISDSFIDENGFVAHHELKSLYMHNCRLIPKRPYLSVLMGHFRSLMSLDISECVNIDDNSLASLGDLSLPMKFLNVGSLIKLSIKSISVLAKNIPGLLEIKIGGAWFLLQTDRIDDRIRVLNPNLKLVRHNPNDDKRRFKQFHRFF